MIKQGSITTEYVTFVYGTTQQPSLFEKKVNSMEEAVELFKSLDEVYPKVKVYVTSVCEITKEIKVK